MKSAGDKFGTRARLDAIEPLLALIDIPIAQRFPHLFPDGQCAESWSDAIRWCAVRTGVSTMTIRRIYRRFKVGGIGALSRRYRSDKGTSRYFKQHPEAAAFAAYLRLCWKLSYLHVHRVILQLSKAISLTEDQAPSNETVRMFLKTTPMPELISLALRGQEKYRHLASKYAKSGFFGKGESPARKIA